MILDKLDDSHTRLLRLLSGGCFVGIVLFLLAAPVQAQPSAFQEAKSAYEFAEYDRAVSLFSKVAEDNTVRDSLRQTALRYMGRAHIAQGQQKKAREAMRKLLEMEPPVIELDPNREPPSLMRIYYETRKQMQGGYTVAKQDPGLQTLAIMDFSNASVTESERWASLAAGFPSMMINFLSGTTELQVIERQNIDWLLDELKLQKKEEVVDQSTAVRMGNLLGATSVLFGNYIVHEDQMRISARLVKVETSEILLAEQVMGDPDDFFGLVKDLSMQVTRAINVELEETELGTSTETQSLDAKIAYSNGLQDLDDGNYQAAYEHFQNALERDPGYELAKRKVESLEPQLAAAKTKGAGDSGGRRDDKNR